MALQLLLRNDVTEFDGWKDAFDADYEARMHAGLSVLQIWRAEDAPGTVWILLDVNDAGKARAYLRGEHLRLLYERAGVTDSEHHLLETA
ncbi:hypothetical protein P1J78_16285 [Psychromarinibacter sp. C21-152]|uniref:Uncharacterized protein n=1 Tax=Psychromarinibacter sediminicola TaxID=3033385 RepID=A0AAE3T989_9RHOB|nr:hypothetical protein [Psychromarinibacter sediminicola]MDF0602300.1 hypothetical protein [Psychromarinibacter sediminicola]